MEHRSRHVDTAQRSRLTRETIAEMTLLDYGTGRLTALCNAVHPQADSKPLIGAFQHLMSPWGDQRLGHRPRYRSGISDDEAPFEFSVAISDGTPVVQVYVEVLGEPPEPSFNMMAGRAALILLARQLGSPLDRLHEVENLFFPDVPGPPFSLWVGASWAPGREMLLKVYLNPQVRGRSSAPKLLAECMRRLEFNRAWENVKSALLLSDGRDEATIVCLDLSKATQSRVKVYVRHHRATVREVSAIARLAQDLDESDVATFYSILAKGDGGFSSKGPITELAFADTTAVMPSEVSLEFPIGSYVATDADARERILRCFTAFGLPSADYDRAVQGVATRPLDERAGIHAHVTLRRPPASTARPERRPSPRIAVYFASEAYVPTDGRA